MPGPETRVTKISKLKDAKVSGESCLVMIAGPFLGKRYPLVDEDEFTVGRDEKNFIVCDMDNVSRRHAQVVLKGGKFFVNDLAQVLKGVSGDDLQKEAHKSELPAYLALSRDVMAVAVWFRRFAQAELKTDGE